MKTKPPVLDKSGLELAAAESHAATIISRRQAVRVAVVVALIFAAAFGVLAVMVLGPALGRMMEDRRKRQSYGNVASLTIGMMKIAQETQAEYPKTDAEWETVLLRRASMRDEWMRGRAKGDLVKKENFSLPHTKRGAAVYFFVPGGENLQDPNRVVIYEHPKLWKSGGGHAGFDNGMVRWFNKEEFEALLESLRLQDGTPWRPHEGVPSPRVDADGE